MSQSHAFGPRPLRFQLSFGVVTLLMFSLFAVAPLLGILVYSYQENERSALANLERQVNRNMAETQQASVELIDSVARNMAIVAAVTAANPRQCQLARRLYRRLCPRCRPRPPPNILCGLG